MKMKLFSHIVIKNRKLIIMVNIIVTIIFGISIKNLKVNADIISYLPRKDKTVRLFNYIGREYGGSLLAMVAIVDSEIFTRETIRQLSTVTSRLKEIDEISYVTSLTNIVDIKATEEGIEIGKLINESDLPETKIELNKLKSYVLSKDLYRGHIISNDARATLIICRLTEGADELKVAKEIRKVVTNLCPNKKTYFGGLPFLMEDVGNIIMRDLKLLIPIVILLIGASLFVSFRSLNDVLLPLLSVFTSTIWTIGLMSFLKVPLTVISDIIPVILVAVGSAYTIHIISRFNESLKIFKDGYRAAEHSLSKIGFPVMLAAVTTIAGFISFIFGSYLSMIREFGIFCSIGIFFTLFVSLTFIPSLLSFQRKGKTVHYKRREYHINIFEKLLSLKKARFVLLSSMVILLVAISGIPRMTRKADILDYFKESSETRKAENVMKAKFGGSTPIYILAKGDIQSPANLQDIIKAEEFLKSQTDVHNVQSIADYIKEMSYVIGEGKTIPDSKEKVSNLWFLLEGEDFMQQFVNDDNSEAVIHATIGSGLNIQKVKGLLKKIENYIDENNKSSLQFQLTGMPSIYKNLDRSIIRSQFQSLIIALLLVYLIIVLQMRSFISGLLGFIPIGFALIVVYGFMGYTHIPLDIATVLVGSISIGIGVDYSIHFMSRYRTELRDSKNSLSSLRLTLKTTGEAILINVISVTLGFIVLVFANLIPLERFGILVAVTMLSSGFGAIVLLPSVIVMRMHMNESKEGKTGRGIG